MKESGQKIIAALDKITRYGTDMHRVFDDFLDIALASLEALPAHLESVRVNHSLAEDTPETQSLFARLRERYPKEAFDCFSEAMAYLMESADEYQDAIGQAFMLSYSSNAYAGQFFTPFHVCKLMSQITLGDIDSDIRKRLFKACEGDVLLQMRVAAGYTKTGQDQYNYFICDLLPDIIDKVEPITIADPCCGSGGMFLAAASQIDRWVIDSGLVRFGGQDIDLRCIKMCKINCKLYGLDGSHLRWIYEISLIEAEKLPEEMRVAAKTALAVPEEERAEFIELFNKGRYCQAPLFEMPAKGEQPKAIAG